MALEMYFALGLVFFVSVNAVAEAERYVENNFMDNEGVFSRALSFCSDRIDSFFNYDDEFYCFFKKDAFDLN